MLMQQFMHVAISIECKKIYPHENNISKRKIGKIVDVVQWKGKVYQWKFKLHSLCLFQQMYWANYIRKCKCIPYSPCKFLHKTQKNDNQYVYANIFGIDKSLSVSSLAYAR